MIDVPPDLLILRGVPGHVRSDNGSDFVAQGVRAWISVVGSMPAHIEPGSPWESGYVESFKARHRDELLKGGDLLQPAEGRDRDRKLAQTHQHRPPHTSFGYRPQPRRSSSQLPAA